MFRLLLVAIIRPIHEYKKEEIIHLLYWLEISKLTSVLYKVYNVQCMCTGRIK